MRYCCDCLVNLGGHGEPFRAFRFAYKPRMNSLLHGWHRWVSLVETGVPQSLHLNSGLGLYLYVLNR